MNTKNLILTSTVGMSREDWLAFRKPVNHVKKFIQTFAENIWHDATTNKERYNFLKILFSKDSFSKEWQEFEFPCIGASEISCLIGLNPYKSIIELFYEKVGIKETFDQDNIAMFWGRELEAAIAEKWQYWEGSPESLIENFAAGKIIRKCRRMNAYCQNKNFPWIFVSVDRIINKSDKFAEGVNECKTISGFAANMWENGIPPMYVAQLQAQIAVTELDYGEMTILKDGRYFDVYPFDKSEMIANKLITESKRFFENVKAGIEQYLLGLYSPDEQTRLDHYAKIDNLSPEPDGSTSYEKYLNKTYEDKGFEITGGLYELGLAKDYVYFGGQIKSLETLQTERSNKIKAIMKDASCISFGQDGQCTWREGAKSRTFRVNVKIDPDYKPDVMKAGEPEEKTVEEKVIAHNIDTKKEKKSAKVAS